MRGTKLWHVTFEISSVFGIVPRSSTGNLARPAAGSSRVSRNATLGDQEIPITSRFSRQNDGERAPCTLVKLISIE